MPTISDEEIEAMRARVDEDPSFIKTLEFSRWIATHKTAVVEWGERRKAARDAARRAQEQADADAS